jgi:hypothetical protein
MSKTKIQKCDRLDVKKPEFGMGKGKTRDQRAEVSRLRRPAEGRLRRARDAKNERIKGVFVFRVLSHFVFFYNFLEKFPMIQSKRQEHHSQ